MVLILLISLTSCNKLKNQTNKNSIVLDSFDCKSISIETTVSFFDSIANVQIDTSTLDGKRQKIMNTFIIEQSPAQADFDTLFDINYDGYKDYLIGYYGLSGTGIKNRVKTYFYNPKNNSYLLNKTLSDLSNLTFYIDRKKITGFYIGHGGGGGTQLEWINNDWIVTKEFGVSNNGGETKWYISYPLKGKELIISKPFQCIPPKEILETDIKF